MQFIGQLYKAKLLTEKIMHNCIIQLLSEEQNPRAEDVECLCKLMMTVRVCGGGVHRSEEVRWVSRPLLLINYY